jgi:glutamate racemase
MRFALLDSGLGVLPTAARLRLFRPDDTIILSMDPDGMPWGQRKPTDIVGRMLKISHAAVRYNPDIFICASNTGTIHALTSLRAEFGAVIPVIGTVPAIESAAAAGEPIAVWATTATVTSPYLAQLIERFSCADQVVPIACPEFAAAVELGAHAKIAAAVTDALAKTPEHVRHVVLGCTQYELAARWIAAARPELILYGSAHGVARRALHLARFMDRSTRTENGDLRADDERKLLVLLGGREGRLPEAALNYIEGRAVAGVDSAAAGVDSAARCS